MRISDWSSDVCSSDLFFGAYRHLAREELAFVYHYGDFIYEYSQDYLFSDGLPSRPVRRNAFRNLIDLSDFRTAYSQQLGDVDLQAARCSHRSEEHTSELQSLMRISYAVFCLKKKNGTRKTQ